jgi:hypothetical protein
VSPQVVLGSDDVETLSRVEVQFDRADLAQLAEVAIDRQYGGVPMLDGFAQQVAGCAPCQYVCVRNGGIAFRQAYWLNRATFLPDDYGLDASAFNHVDDVFDAFEAASERWPTDETECERQWEAFWHSWHQEPQRV